MTKLIRRVSFVIVAAALLAMLPTARVHAQAPAVTAVTGTVTNGTAGSPVPASVPVALRFYDAEGWTDIYTTTLSAAGTFRFAELDSYIEQDFVTSVDHQGVTYYSKPATVQADTEVVADLVIYDATEDIAAVQVDQVHYFIVPATGTARIAEFYLLGNTGDRTYIGTLDAATGMRTTVTFSPPPAATALTFDSLGIGERFIGDETRFADSRPIMPGRGTVEVNFSYDLLYTEGQVIERSLDIPIASVVALVSSDSIGIEGDGLAPAGFMSTQMGMAASYQGEGLGAGEALRFAFVPQTMVMPTAAPAAATPVQQSSGDGLAIGIVTVAAGAAAIYWLWIRPRHQSSVAPIPAEAQAIVEEIISADQALAAGEIGEAEHAQRVKELQRRLEALVGKAAPAPESAEPPAE